MTKKKTNKPWCYRFDEYIEIALSRGYIVITNKEDWENGTKKEKKNFKPEIMCVVRGHVIKKSINNFINHKQDCVECGKLEPPKELRSYYHRYNEFIKNLTSRGWRVITTHIEWQNGTKKEGSRYKPYVICPSNHEITNTIAQGLFNKDICIQCNKHDIWYNCYPEFLELLTKNNMIFDYDYEMNEVEWKKIVQDNTCKIKVRCVICNTIDTLTIQNIVECRNKSHLTICRTCNKKNFCEVYPNSSYNNYHKFQKLVESKGYILNTTEEEWKHGTKENAINFKPNMS